MPTVTPNEVNYFNNWSMQGFENHIRISYNGTTTTRVNYMGELGYGFTGKNPLKLPKAVQKWINEWLECKCRKNGTGVWDCEAWMDYQNTPVVQ